MANICDKLASISMLAAVWSDIKVFLLFLLISLAIILTDYFGFLSIPKSALQTITVPVQFGLYKTSNLISRQLEFIILARRASQENKALNEQLSFVLSENARLQKQLSEAEAFLAQQKSLDAQTFNLIPARPIGISRYLYIDKGQNHGIKPNQAVIFKENMIGKVKQVSAKTSLVMLTSDPDFRVGAFASSTDGKAKGVLAGQFGSEMLLDKILHQEPLKNNDLVYTEGAELEVPRGLILGRISEIDDKDNEVFKKAKVRSVFDVKDLEVVFVITN
ncbi:rod shape-determining protein MreC [Candidatus Daviesbacteria bacterium]|nr:rod shape-determining protein MreC [Candidatus Daviesbacteria bacterium]